MSSGAPMLCLFACIAARAARDFAICAFQPGVSNSAVAGACISSYLHFVFHILQFIVDVLEGISWTQHPRDVSLAFMLVALTPFGAISLPKGLGSV